MDLAPDTFAAEHFGAADLGDRRRTRRLVRAAERLARHPGGSLPQAMQSPADLKALYRLANHPRVTHAAVLRPHLEWTRRRMAEHPGVVLLVHDTTELDFTGKTSLHPELGYLGGPKQRGYLCHNSLAADAATGEPLGLANQLLHARPRRDPAETRARRRRRADRESRLWKAGREAVGPVPPGRRWVDVCDRGGDGFEFLAFEHAAGHRYLVRSQSNRRVRVGHGPGGPAAKLHDHLRGLAGRGRRPLDVPAAPPGRGRPAPRAARRTEVAVAWAAVTLPPPAQARGEHGRGPLAAWAVRAWEPGPPPGAEPLEWLLLTNEPVGDLADAWGRVDWYALRWPVAEEYHKAQKTGCAIEGPQFTTAQALRPVIGLLSVVAWFLLRLRYAGRSEGAAARPATAVVPAEYVAVLSRWRHGRERPAWTAREFLWALGRLGGHQNRTGDGAPGWQVLWKGWVKLQVMLQVTPTTGPPGSGQT
jgi:Transposase DNA-binding